MQGLGKVETAEMYRVFNMGIGLALIVSPFYADNICRMLDKAGLMNSIIGHAIEAPRRVVLQNP